MIPKDPVTEREEAITLWSEGALDPITFFEKLDFPDPKQAAEQLFMWKADPALLFPEVAQKMQGPAKKAPSESLNYKDAPDSIKRQIEQQAGLQPATDPETDPTHEKLVAQSMQHTHEHQVVQHQGIVDHQKLQHEALHTSNQASQQAEIARQSAEQQAQLQAKQKSKDG